MLSSIDLHVAQRLNDPEFRKHWFRAMLEDNVPEQFRALRERREMTQSELADAAGMKQSAISRFEIQRVANWKLETLLKMADALDAQLEITIIPAEQVIARYAREETSDSSQPKSVLEVRPGAGHGFNSVGGLASKIGTLAIDEAHGLSPAILRSLEEFGKVMVVIDRDDQNAHRDEVRRPEAPRSAVIAAERVAQETALHQGKRRWN